MQITKLNEVCAKYEQGTLTVDYMEFDNDNGGNLRTVIDLDLRWACSYVILEFGITMAQWLESATIEQLKTLLQKANERMDVIEYAMSWQTRNN